MMLQGAEKSERIDSKRLRHWTNIKLVNNILASTRFLHRRNNYNPPRAPYTSSTFHDFTKPSTYHSFLLITHSNCRKGSTFLITISAPHQHISWWISCSLRAFTYFAEEWAFVPQMRGALTSLSVVAIYWHDVWTRRRLSYRYQDTGRESFPVTFSSELYICTPMSCCLILFLDGR